MRSRLWAGTTGRALVSVSTFALLSIIKAATVCVGAVFLLLAGRAYWRTRAASMRTLFVAVALLVLAAVAEGASLQVLRLSLEHAHIIEAVVTLAAFVVLLASVLAHRPA